MSLYEIESMMRSLEKIDGKGRTMSDEDFEKAKDRWRAMNLPDVYIPDSKDD